MIHVHRIYRTGDLTINGHRLVITDDAFTAVAVDSVTGRFHVLGTGDSPEAVAAAEEGFTGFTQVDEEGREWVELVTKRKYIFGYATA